MNLARKAMIEIATMGENVAKKGVAIEAARGAQLTREEHEFFDMICDYINAVDELLLHVEPLDELKPAEAGQ